MLNREQVALQFLPRIESMARRLSRRLPEWIDRADLVQAGVVGMMTALDSFDANRCDRVEAYLERRVHGALLDELRAMDPLSRDQRADLRTADRVSRQLETSLGRRADDDEVAAASALTTERVRELRQLAQRVVCDTLTDVHAERLSDERAEDPCHSMALRQLRERLVHALDQLPERQRLILSLLYVDELTLKEIGHLLDVSESRVCQLRRDALERLRSAMATIDCE